MTLNPSIERTSKRLRRLAAAHVERWASQHMHSGSLVGESVGVP